MSEKLEKLGKKNAKKNLVVQAGFQDGCAVVMKVADEVEVEKRWWRWRRGGGGGGGGGGGCGDWVKKIWELEIPASYLRATLLSFSFSIVRFFFLVFWSF